MGAGIAHAYLVAGAGVSLVEVDPGIAAAVPRRIRSMLDKTVERGQVGIDPEECLARLAVSPELSAVAEADLVIEAVPEDPGLKARVLSRIEAGTEGRAVIASNTSSISIDHLAASLRRPERLVGMHFFNPVPASLFVEVVRGAASSEEAVETAVRWVGLAGKEIVLVRDSPGFASSRLGVLLGLEAIRMLEEGVASAEDIDKAMTLGYKHPIGPLHLGDLVGLDVRLAIAEYLNERLGERFAPPRLLRDMVAAGHLGRKTGRGFFAYR
jgi:3-hydroxybutyryl-CoA dehydrogenase